MCMWQIKFDLIWFDFEILKTAQQVSERNRFWLCITSNGDIRKCQQNNFDQCGVFVTFIELGKSVKNKFLFTMTTYPGETRMTLGQLCAALWDFQSWPDVITARIRTRDCSDASCTELQCLRTLGPCVCFNYLTALESF